MQKSNLPNNSKTVAGQLWIDPRSSKPKAYPTPEVSHGMRSRIAPSPLQDEPLQKKWEGKQVPVSFGMKSRSDGAQEADGFAMLRDAGRLGRKG